MWDVVFQGCGSCMLSEGLSLVARFCSGKRLHDLNNYLHTKKKKSILLKISKRTQEMGAEAGSWQRMGAEC